MLRAPRNVRRLGNRGPKLPSFTGKESWDVYYNRFEDIAMRCGWDDDEKLDELLPKLQGVAGEFVYGQLSQRTRSSYRRIVRELRNRFRVVETAKSYSARFSTRSQKPGETVEEFVAELKRLYDKGHPLRDRRTREEDLLRRFFDGLLDDRARQQVEYVKDPKTIDEAAYEVVNFTEMKRRNTAQSRRNARVKVSYPESSSSEDEGETRIARLPGRPPKSSGGDQGKEKPTQNLVDDTGNASLKEEIAELKRGLAETTSTLTKCLKSLNEGQPRQQQQRRGPHGGGQQWNGNQGGPQRNNQNGQPRGNQTTAPGDGQRHQPRFRSFMCFKCGQEGHFARDCLVMSSQFQVQSGLGQNPIQQIQQGPLNPNGSGPVPEAVGQPSN